MGAPWSLGAELVRRCRSRPPWRGPGRGSGRVGGGPGGRSGRVRGGGPGAHRPAGSEGWG